MRIGFINTGFNPSGGVGRVMFRIASELAKNHQVCIIALDGKQNDDFYQSSGVRLVVEKSIWHQLYFHRFLHKVNQKTSMFSVVNRDSLYDWIYLPNKLRRQWKEIIEREQLDVVIALQGNNSIVLGSIADELKCKTVGWQHNSYDAYFNSKGIYMWHQDNLFDRMIPRLDSYVVLNNYDKDCLKKYKNIQATTIYNPRSFVSNEKSPCINKRFIAVGHLIPAKGFDLLIESFAIFAKYNKEWTLDIYGEGHDKDKIQQLINKKHLQDRITLRGISRNIQGEMLQSSVFLLSSRWEGMPMVILEALEMGLPIIAYDITAMNPLVTNQKEGIIVPKFDTKKFADSMLLLANDVNLRLMYSNQAKDKSQEFDIARIIELWNDIISK